MLLAGLFGGADGDAAAGLMGVGAVVIVLAVSLFSPHLVPPLAAIAGWPLERMRRLIGRLARENSQRNPGRTAVTAAALMIGLALVAFVTVFAAGLKSSIASAVDDNFQGDLVSRTATASRRFPPAPRWPPAKCRGSSWSPPCAPPKRSWSGSGAKPRVNSLSSDAGEVFELEWTRVGRRRCATSATARRLVEDSFASDHDLELGDGFQLLSQAGKRPRLRVVGTYEDQGRPGRQPSSSPRP